MGRINKSGVRGLVHDTVTDAKTGEVTDRWSIDLRYRDKDGQPQRYRERLPDGITAAAAKAKARRINNSAESGVLIASDKQAKPLGEALDAIVKWGEVNRPASQQMRKTQAGALKRILGASMRLDDLSPLAVERFKRERRSELRKAAGVAPDDDEDLTGAASVNRGLAVLFHAANLWSEWGWMRESVAGTIRKAKKVPEPEGRVRYLSPEEEGGLREHLPVQVVQVVIAATLTGMRRSELVRLKKAAVDLRSREITVVKAKSGKSRRIPINDALHLVLETAMAQSKTEYVFVSERGAPFKADSISHAFGRACKKAGIVDLRFHDCRHHFATMVRRNGGDLDIVRQLLGHAHLSMTERYAHVGREQLHEAVANLGAVRIAQNKG